MRLRIDKYRLDKWSKIFFDPDTGEQKAIVDTQWIFEMGMIEEEGRKILTDRLRKKADNLYVALPEIPYAKDVYQDEHWIKGDCTQVWYLKPAGAEKVRKAIYEERKRRQELSLPKISALTGLIGALIGLIAVMLQCSK